LQTKHMTLDRRTRKTGFTLIELVIVLSIVAIMAAIALPRYINLQVQARTAKAQAIYGSIKSAATLARASCMVDLAGLVTPSTCTSTAGTTLMDGIAVNMVNQFPAATATGIQRAAQLVAADDAVTITVANPMLIDINGGTAPNCRISYTEATSGPIAPVITLDTTGC
jgi:MSHA pilin protein MshA